MPSKYNKLLEDEKINYMFKGQDPREPFPMFGFEVCEGWFNLIKSCLYEIAKEDKDKTIKVAQLKEKYASLRIYINGGTDKIYDIIDKYETISETTCEICGEPGTINTEDSWWLTCRCLKHRDSKGNL